MPTATLKNKQFFEDLERLMRTKTEEKREAILAVAAATFNELGFERTSMSEICSRLGGSKATLYNYFPSKEALLLEVMFRASKADFERTLQALDALDHDVGTALRNFGQRFLGMLYDPCVLAARRLLVAQAGRAELGKRCFQQGPARSHACVGQFLQQSMDRGLLRPACTRLAAQHLQALLEAELITGFLFQHVPVPTTEEIAQCTDRAVDAFLHLYAPTAS